MLAHALQGPRCHIILLCFGKETRQRHNVCWQSRTWLTASLGLELAALAGELEAKLGTEAAPIPTAAWPQPWPSTARGNGLAH